MTLSRIALIASLLMLTASTAFADIIRVGPNRTYTTIQDGVDNASVGDTILIDNGVYVETVQVMTADLTIRPAKKGKKGKVTIDGGGAGIPLVVVGSGCVVQDLRVSNAMTSGIAVNGADIKVIRCTVMGGGEGVGIRTLSATNCTIAKCKVLNANDVGIFIGTTSLGAVITKCTVKDAGGEGMVIASDSVSVTNNKIIRSGKEGLELGDAGNMWDCIGSLIIGNDIRDAGLSSVLALTNSSHCVIENNVVRNGGVGFLIATDNHLLAGNVVDGSSSDSFHITNSTGTKLYKNVGRDCSADNFESSSSCTYTDFVKNKSRRAGDNGFEIEGANDTLLYNDSRKSNRASGTGLDFETASATDLLYVGNSYDTSDF